METELVEEELVLIGSCIDFKSGQKFATPSPGSGDRVFYETLLTQNPDSEMAQEWCVAYGILSEEKAQEIYKKICKRKGKPCVLTPVKKTSTSVSVAVKASVTETKKKAGRSKRKVIEDDVDELGESAGWEGQGTVGV